MNMIKSIRIVEKRSPSNKGKHNNEPFSFSKPNHHPPLPSIQSQQEVISQLQTMIKRMLKKCKKQEEKISESEEGVQRWEECESRNRALRG